MLAIPILRARIQRYPASLVQPPHAHHTASVTLVLRGTLRERSGTSDVAAGPLSLVVKPAGTVHADHYGPDPVLTCQVTLPPEAHDEPRWRLALQRWRWINGGPTVAAALALARDLEAREDDAALAVGAAAVLEALRDEPPARVAPAWLPRAVAYLDDAVRSGAGRVSIADAAVVAGVHPVHLSRVFQRHLGCSVSGWVRRRRVQWAADALTRWRGSLSEVATASGFADQSHMNRIFRRETGALPASYRTLAHALMPEALRERPRERSRRARRGERQGPMLRPF